MNHANIFIVAVTVLTLLSARASAAPDDGACLTAFEAAQTHRKAGELAAAQRELTTCGQAACPTVVRSKCIEWLEEVRAIQPSIVVTVKDAAGEDTSQARLFVDGELVRAQLDGRPIELDPGSHTVRVEHGSEPPKTQQVVVAEGQLNREITISFEAEAPVAEAGVELSPLFFVGAGVAGVGLVVGAITGGLALSKASELEDVCPDTSRCTEAGRDAYDEGLVLSHVSTAAFVTAGVGAALGAVGLLLSEWEAGPTEEALRVTVGPGGVVLGGSF